MLIPLVKLMKTHLYFSLVPECLVASMLPPEQFGRYYAVGTRNRSSGQALFFEIDPDFESDFFPLKDLDKLCKPHPDGNPRRSTYLSIYRVLENLPLSVFGNLHLTTTDGRTLALSQAPMPQPEAGRLHLYQEFCPVNPRVASNLDPASFLNRMTDVSQPVSVDKLVFCEMRLEGLATDPENASVEDLPYRNLDHIRDCLMELVRAPDKPTKIVRRSLSQTILYRTIRTGFFVGDKDRALYYPMPDPATLERDHHDWWQSALNTFNT